MEIVVDCKVQNIHIALTKLLQYMQQLDEGLFMPQLFGISE